MAETRAEKFGTNLGIIVLGLSESLNVKARDPYLTEVLGGVARYSLMRRKKGSLPNRGSRHSMQDIERIDTTNPLHVAEFVKYCFDMTYNKTRAALMKHAFMRELDDYLTPENFT
jgi:hypothetical protein